MICPKCDGRGFKLLMNRFCDLYTEVCDKCGGSGVVEPMTNEEYIRQASTEELAKFFQKITDRCFACGVKNADGTSNEPCKERFCSRLVFEWLKEIHK